MIRIHITVTKVDKKIVSVLMLAVMITAAIPAAVKADTQIWTSWVYSNGTPVTTPVILENGVTYRIEVSEVFNYDLPHNLAADAMYYTTQYPSSWDWGNHFPAPGGHSFLQINGADVNWGPFSNGDQYHTYTNMYTGTGAAITFRIIDWVDNDYSNNQCHLVVKIFAPDRYYGATPGYWKQPQHFSAWTATGYETDDITQGIFGPNAPTGTLLQALQGGGGSGIAGAKKILARAAVAALLNSEAFTYRYSESWIIEQVTNQFNSGTRASILALASDLDHWNNMGRP